jgi:hypothetical protein
MPDLTYREWRVAVLDDPSALGPYCDWLEERGRPSAELRELLARIAAGDARTVLELKYRLMIGDVIEKALAVANVMWFTRRRP